MNLKETLSKMEKWTPVGSGMCLKKITLASFVGSVLGGALIMEGHRLLPTEKEKEQPKKGKEKEQPKKEDCKHCTTCQPDLVGQKINEVLDSYEKKQNECADLFIDHYINTVTPEYLGAQFVGYCGDVAKAVNLPFSTEKYRSERCQYTLKPDTSPKQFSRIQEELEKAWLPKGISKVTVLIDSVTFTRN